MTLRIDEIMFCYCFRVSYKDGVMENEPKPCAAVKGTQIMVCDVVTC